MKNLRIIIWTITALSIASTAAIGGVTEVDFFTQSWARIDLQYPDGAVETIDLYGGPSEIHVFFEGSTEGTANDDDTDGLEEVQTELVAMNRISTGQMPFSRREHPMPPSFTGSPSGSIPMPASSAGKPAAGPTITMMMQYSPSALIRHLNGRSCDIPPNNILTGTVKIP